MHVLLTNDDGPPSDETSPYIIYFVNAIRKYTNWDLSVCLPDQQRSWIGKAHFAGKDLTASFIKPNLQNNSYDGPYAQPKHHYDDTKEEWALIDGTPASAADIGIHHLFPNKGPVDLVISGPNYGRNSTATYIMSSGTVGAALEAALSDKKAIGLSFAFNTRTIEPDVLDQAAKIAVFTIKHLYENWPSDKSVDLYSVNIPLTRELNDETKIFYAPILQNRWGSTYSFNGELPERDPENKADIVDSSEAKKVQFHWSPDFSVVHDSVAVSEPGNDGWTVQEGYVSVTPMKATFKDLPLREQINIKIPKSETAINGHREAIKQVSTNEYIEEADDKSSSRSHTALITIDEESYIYPAIKQSITKYLPNIPIITSSKNLTTTDNGKLFQFSDYEDFDFDRVMTDSNYLICSYIYRKALIRKHFLANTIHSFIVKHPESLLIESFPNTYSLELDYAEFLDDALDEVYELRQELEENESKSGNERKVYILKPSMSDKGQGIRLFTTIDELQSIFEEFEEENDDESENENEDNNGIITSQLRHFVIQDYITKTLLLPFYQKRKFHIRSYILCKGSLQVFVYKHMLALFSNESYETPIETDGKIDMKGHLTNTCLQENDYEHNGNVFEFWKLEGLSDESKEKIYTQIKSITSDLFLAALNNMIHFQTIPNAFEIFGIDFLIDEDLKVHLLEVNSYPDFKQTGDDLKEMIYNLFDDVVKCCVIEFFEEKKNNQQYIGLDCVLDKKTQGW